MRAQLSFKLEAKGQPNWNVIFSWRGGHSVVVGGQRWILNWPDPSYRREENLSVLINPEGFHRLEVGVGGGV